MPQAPGGDGSPLGDLLNVLWRRRYVVLATIVFFTVPAAVIGLRSVPEYTASTAVMVEPRESRVVDVEQVLQRLPADQAAIATQIDVIRSYENIAQTIEDLDLLHDPELMPTEDLGVRDVLVAANGWLPDGWLRSVGWPGQAQSQTPDNDDKPGQPTENGAEPASRMAATDVIAAIADHQSSRERIAQHTVARLNERLAVDQSRESYVLWISYTSRDPAKAARVANHLANVYVDGQLKEKRGATTRATAWLRDRLDALQEQVVSAERRAELFRAEQGLVAAKGSTLGEEQLANINQSLIGTRTAKAALGAKLRLIRELQASRSDLGAILEVQDSRVIENLRAQQAELSRKEAELARTLGSRHPQMQALRDESARLAAAIEMEVNRIIRALENELTTLAAREVNLEQELATATSEGSIHRQAEARLRQLEREADAMRQMYENFLLRFYETREQGEVLEPDARVIYPAQVPEDPSSLPPFVFAVVGLTASTAFGCVLALLLEQMDGRLRSGVQVEARLGVPCLGLLPKVRRLRPGYTVRDHIQAQPYSSYTEAVRGLFNVTRASAMNPPPKVILVTSALPGEGKTCLATSLALCAAQTGARTLLVDFDLRHPSVMREFNLTPKPDAPKWLGSRVLFHDALVSDQASGIDILPLAQNAHDLPTLFSSQQVQQLLATLRARYDWIVVDAPPILGLADAQVLAQHVDATIVTVRWQRTKQRSAAVGLKALRDVGATVAGVVLTQVELKKHANCRYGDAEQYYRHYRKYHVESA